MQDKSVKFIHDRVVGHFHPIRTAKKDSEATHIAEQISNMLPNNGFGVLFGYLWAYTTELEFNWQGDEPEEVVALEKMWKMVENNDLPVEIYDWSEENLPLYILTGWDRAMSQAHTPWKPSRENNNIDDEEADPNS
jgi:hypothetical protein